MKHIKDTLFRIMWMDYDSSTSWLLYHPGKTKDDFLADYRKSLKDVGQAYIETARSWIGVNDWMAAAVEEMVKNGYELVDPALFQFKGGLILDGDDIDGVKWAGIVGVDLMRLAVECNRWKSAKHRIVLGDIDMNEWKCGWLTCKHGAQRAQYNVCPGDPQNPDCKAFARALGV